MITHYFKGYSTYLILLFTISFIFVNNNKVLAQCTSYSEPANPNLAAVCPMKVVLVLDESRSIDLGNGTTGVVNGALALANSLLGTGSEMAVIEFSSYAHRIVIDGSKNLQPIDNAFISSFNTYLTTTTSNAANDSLGFDPAHSVAGYTNWEAGIRATYPLATDADIIIFMTDGVPNSWLDNNGAFVGPNTNFNQTALNEAITAVNVLKQTYNKHVFVIGVTNSITTCSIQDISGTDVYPSSSFSTSDYTLSSNFSTLATDLRNVALEICGTTLSLNKSISSSSGCVGKAESFTITVQNTGSTNAAALVVVKDTIPSGFTYTGNSPSIGTVSVSGNIVTWSIGSIAVGATATLTINVTANGSGNFINKAYATGSNLNAVVAAAGAGYTIFSPPIPSATGGTFCESSSISISGNGGLSYVWTGPSGYMSTTQNPTVTNNAVIGTHNGTYTLKVTDSNGCTATTTANVVIDAKAIVNAGPDLTICASPTPPSVPLAGSSRGGSSTTATWTIISGGGGLSNSSAVSDPTTVSYNPLSYVPANGNYSVDISLRLTTNDPTGVCPAVYDDRVLSINYLTGGTISSNQTICTDGDPAAISDAP